MMMKLLMHKDEGNEAVRKKDVSAFSSGKKFVGSF